MNLKGYYRGLIASVLITFSGLFVNLNPQPFNLSNETVKKVKNLEKYLEKYNTLVKEEPGIEIYFINGKELMVSKLKEYQSSPEYISYLFKNKKIKEIGDYITKGGVFGMGLFMLLAERKERKMKKQKQESFTNNLY